MLRRRPPHTLMAKRRHLQPMVTRPVPARTVRAVKVETVAGAVVVAADAAVAVAKETKVGGC